MSDFDCRQLVRASRWGATSPHLPDTLMALLKTKFPEARPWPMPTGSISCQTQGLDASFLRSLSDLGDGVSVTTDLEARARAALGMGTEDLVHIRLGALPHLPAAVVAPAGHDEVVSLLKLCSEAGVKLVPRGGGTSVTGAVNVPHGAIVMDLCARMNRVLGRNDGGALRAQAGILGPALEAAAREAGRTVGHFPQSFERSTLGGWIAARSAGQFSSRHGRAEEMIVGLRAATPAGEVRVPDRPASAVGPDPIALLAGSEGSFAIITEATIRTVVYHEELHATAWLMPGFEVGVKLARSLSEDGLCPSALRLSDENETERLLAAAHLSSVVRGGLSWLRQRSPRCLLLIVADGSPDEIKLISRRVRAAALRAGGVPLGSSPARQWLKTRFSQPELRDSLLDAGIVTDTMETSVSWGSAVSLCERVRAAVATIQPRIDVGVHVSHVYPDGCSLYFTVLMAPSPQQALETIITTRQAIARAFLQHGCPLSHHHGAGRYLAALVPEQIGETALSALRAVKKNLDPKGILNPGLALDAE